MLTQERLKEILHYCPDSGLFTWKTKPRKNQASGTLAGTLSDLGYIKITIDGRKLRAHRLAFLYMGNAMPSICDHINCNRADNRWANLREASHKTNATNKRMSARNQVGLKGVVRRPSGNYIAQIISNGMHHFLGTFSTAAEAHDAYCRASALLHADFANFG